MPGSLGEKVGEGAVSDVHAWAPGQVLKLFKAGVPHWFGAHEARVTRAVFAAGVAAPEVFEEVTLDGRFGIVLQRFHGPTLSHLLRSGAMKSAQAGTILATLYRSVHGTPPPPEAPLLRKWFAAASRVPDGIPAHIATGVLDWIDHLPPEDGLCHADLHPANVIITAEGPRLIDWAASVRAPGALDLARCHVTLFDLAYAPEDLDPTRPRALNAIVQSEYARLAGISLAALLAAMEPYLPILRAFALCERATKPARRGRLIQRVEAALRAAG